MSTGAWLIFQGQRMQHHVLMFDKILIIIYEQSNIDITMFKTMYLRRILPSIYSLFFIFYSFDSNNKHLLTALAVNGLFESHHLYRYDC